MSNLRKTHSILNGDMAEAESVERFAELISAYLPTISSFLIDPSGGRGRPFNVKKVADYLHVIRNFPMVGYGVAGGLGPDTLHSIDPLVREFPELSIDAEGRLRTPEPEDALSLEAMREYLEDAFLIMAGKKLPGQRLMTRCSPYGLREHPNHYGLGDNMLRTERLAQPCALNVGDILATGDKVLSPPREGGNGSVLLHLTGGFDGHWVGVPARIPIALLTADDDAPSTE